MSDTPRTDAQYKEYARRDNEVKCVYIDFARTLERELGEANAKLSKLSRMIDIAGQANDAASEAEVANSATFLEALAHTNTEMVEAERDQLCAEVERLRAWGSRRDEEMQHQAKLAMEARGERDQLRAEVERWKASWESAVKLANENADSVVIANREIDQWRAVADSLAQELTDNLAPGLPSTGLADYEKLKSDSK